MCGILGVIHREPGNRPPLNAKELALLAHRGPDGDGAYTDAHAQLGHTRLAIIDLTDTGSQPMLSQDGRYVVTFNGEIYNYVELRKELEGLGEHFSSNSDTEVLLTAYKVWGRDCVDRFRGMFAFALWDSQTRSLFLGRDRCGEKPLFYYQDADRFIFASELKALTPLIGRQPDLNPEVVDLYLHFQYVPEPFTLLRDVHKLPAAHTMWLSPDAWQTTPHRYWNVEDIVDPSPSPETEADILASIREKLEEAVLMTLRADVPVAVALSGGIDSGAIAAFAQKHYPEPMHAFCVGYPGRPPYDERAQARALAESLGMIVHEVELPVQSFVEFFPSLVHIMDEPIADPAAFGHFSVPKAASDCSIKVLLTGIGGDEIFWGYSWVTGTARTNQMLAKHPAVSSLAALLNKPDFIRLLKKLAHSHRVPARARGWFKVILDLAEIRRPKGQLHFMHAAPDFSDLFSIKSTFYGNAMRDLASENPFRPTEIGPRSLEKIPAAIIRLLFDTWLVSNCLSLGDRVSMGTGVETRLPFLDAPLIELVMTIRAKHPDHTLGQKAWLRAALKDVLPPDVLSRPKAGFQPPVIEWLTGVISEYGAILRDGKLVADGILDNNKIDTLLTSLLQQGWPGIFFVYKLVLLEMWHQKIVKQ